MVQCTQPPQSKLPESKITTVIDDDNNDSPPKPEKRTMVQHIEMHRSCVVTLSDIELNGLQPRRLLQTIEKSPGGGSQCLLHEETPTDTNASHRHAIADAAWEDLKRSTVYFRGQPIGTVAALDKSQGAALNYDQVFMWGFVPSALAFLMKGEHLIVKNFLVETARLQSREKMVEVEHFKHGQGVMPASFKVHHRNPTQNTESLLADCGETAIGRVASVESPNCQRAMHVIIRLCLSEGWDTSPALLCADGCSVIDRRMGIYGYPIEIQSLFFMAIQALSYHLHRYYWLHFQRLNDTYRYKTEGYSLTALNEFKAEAIRDLVELRWQELMGQTVLKICYPAMENQEQKQTARWSCHNCGSQPGEHALNFTGWSMCSAALAAAVRCAVHCRLLGDDHSPTDEHTSEQSDELFAKIVRKAVGLGWDIEKGPENSVYIYLDDIDEFMDSYVNAIGNIGPVWIQGLELV